MNEIGQIASDFCLSDELGVQHRLTDYRGKKVVLYFYPKDLTSGCTKQALGFKELYEEFQNRNAVIIGISKDSSTSHLKFKNKYELPFILLSDEALTVLEAYGVYQEKTLYGKKYMGIVRTTFIIDENGRIIFKQEKVNASQNPSECLCILK